ncbi:FAD/NAD(P)-binding domain-containing protein [Kockiozyma suomiensis]|uniref:FAD/NAD(P)-binding domain-containing protein n=1 Tax=Kockiozyma suomiensis TaxID=1337062 RepID=UPI00334404A0
MPAVAGFKPDYDAIIIGAGFGGVYLLRRLREQGFKVLVIEEAGDLGGVWWWNRYDGARTDSKIPLYEFSDKNLYGDWTWTEKYPGWAELQAYFQHLEKKLQLKKDICFNTRVESAEFSDSSNSWTVTAKNGTSFTARNFILCTGFASKPNIPNFKGLDTFGGIWCHTSKWPREGIDFRGKRAGVVGNGSSGLQVIQEVAPVVEHLTVFQRSPCCALPMRQEKMSANQQDKNKYDDIYKLRHKTFAGIEREFNPKSAVEVSDEERTAFFEEIWEEGGLTFWLGNYYDVIINKESNRLAYDFWRSKVLPRISDPAKAELLAPKEPPYYFGTKRATLEQRYYEVYNQSNVDLVNARANPITEVVKDGVITADGELHKLDILILGTGFDSVTGGILAIEVTGSNGQSLQEKWKNGTWTSMGLTTSGFPNMFFLYGPQGPTSFCNGPTCAEIQGDWIVDTMKYLRSKNLVAIDATSEAEKAWKEQVEMYGNATLLPETASEYMGTNIPGKPKEVLNYMGGLPNYIQQIQEVQQKGFPGFEVY